jgi:hypothetical protein
MGGVRPGLDGEAATWAAAEIERLLSVLAVALSEHDTNEGQFAENFMPKHWTHEARRIFRAYEQEGKEIAP